MAATHVGIFAVRSREYPYGLDEFSRHYFNAAGGELGMQHACFPEYCMVFFPPRKWGDALKRTLVIRRIND